jgi:hypothetical protein
MKRRLKKAFTWLYLKLWLEWLVLRIFYSFPIQLFIFSVRKNQLLLLLWLLLFGMVTQVVGASVGLPFLYLEPEYMGKVNFWSTFIIGITLGGFTMSYHITCYILDGHFFGFLGHLKRPFEKFCLNNSFLPILFLVVYVTEFYQFQTSNALEVQEDIYVKIAGIFAGIFIMVVFFFSYFFITNKDIFSIAKKLKINLNEKLARTKISKVNIMSRYDTARLSKTRVEYYFSNPFRYQRVNEEISIDKKAIFKVFNQNHFNAIVIQASIFILVLVLGYFEENVYFQIPAGASVILLFTLFVMFAGALNFWLRGWSVTFLIVVFLGANFLLKNQIFNIAYEVYGIDYDTPQKPEYSLKNIREMGNDENFKNDVLLTQVALNNWRKKFPKDKKPKIVFLCVSGGGQRASVWAMRALQHVDSTFGGELMNHTMLITGASGGLVGAAYFRELYLRQQQGENINIYADQYFENIAKDNLNGIAFNWVANDLFYRYKKFNYKNRWYYQDRGHALEENLNKNTNNVLNKPLCDYREPELLAQIPMMILSPTVVNDGRKLYISPLNVSYMGVPNIYENRFLNQKAKGTDFLRFFEKQDSGNLRFLSALRMSATFPYITPNVQLPSSPEMEIMDAGIADNFGVEASIRFISVFKKWIQENTSGVVIVSIRDTQKDKPIEKNIEPSLYQRIFTPLEGIYANQEYMQDLHNDDIVEYAQSWFKGDVKIHRIEFQYVPISKNLQEIHDREEGKIKLLPNQLITLDRASLSWHLTTKERNSIHRTIYELRNQSAMRQLAHLLKN